MPVQLPTLMPGQKGRIIKVGTRGGVHRRIVEMGLTPGGIVEMVRIAPLGDPIDIRVRGYHLSLRKTEAETVEVEPL